MSILEELMEQAKKVEMTGEQKLEQRLDFAYGNLAASTNHKPQREVFHALATKLGMTQIAFEAWASRREWLPASRRAAVVVIRRPSDGRYLCVWNRRYAGWSFPGGRVEKTDLNPVAAACRELTEETGCYLAAGLPLAQIYEGPHGVAVDTTRGSTVHVFLALYEMLLGAPREMEVGCPVTWLSRDEFLKWSPFASFYENLLGMQESLAQTSACTCDCHKEGVCGHFHCFGPCCAAPDAPPSKR